MPVEDFVRILSTSYAPEVAVLFVPGGKAEFPDVPEGQFDLQVVEIFRPPLV